MASILAHSGAVVLLQGSDLVFHFSEKLKPWVHYVPLTFSMADMTEKVSKYIYICNCFMCFSLFCMTTDESYMMYEYLFVCFIVCVCSFFAIQIHIY